MENCRNFQYCPNNPICLSKTESKRCKIHMSFIALGIHNFGYMSVSVWLRLWVLALSWCAQGVMASNFFLSCLTQNLTQIGN